RFGQHFLARPSILNAIADAACPPGTKLAVEIGPGRGALTEPLLARAERVIAIELDPVLVQYLRQKFRVQIESAKGAARTAKDLETRTAPVLRDLPQSRALELIEGDVLKMDVGAWGPAAICGNLPYYITSPILERVFAAKSWELAVLMVQAEV